MTTTGPSTPTVRRIATLALPALVVLAAEPVYLLVDTAVVGHLGRVPLAALALGGVILAVAAFLGTVLAYGTTGRAARQFGAGQRAEAVAEGVQASWIAIIAGLVFALVVQFAAGPLTRVLGDDPEVTAQAATWLRIAAWGAPGILLSFAGNGWMRGVQETRRPVRYVLAANLASAALCPILVYPAGLGLPGSALANVVAQAVGGFLFLRALHREGVPLTPSAARMRRQLSLGRDLIIRGLAFQACFLSAAAVAGRFSVEALAAHQITLQLFFFCALVLDAIAIAAQSLVGAALGGGDEVLARTTGRRIAVLGGYFGLLIGAFIGVGAWFLPGLFTDDPAVVAQALIAWPWFAATQPLAGVVFALDGVLIGAGDAAFLRNLTVFAAVAGFLPGIWLSYALDLGLGGVWAGLTMFIVVRLVGLVARTRTGRWAVPGV